MQLTYAEEQFRQMRLTFLLLVCVFLGLQREELWPGATRNCEHYEEKQHGLCAGAHG